MRALEKEFSGGIKYGICIQPIHAVEIWQIPRLAKG
jgi:hypothetical protein